MTAPLHHPRDDTLLDYLAGTLDEFAAALVAAHLEICPSCRAVEVLGGALLEAGPPLAMAPGSLAATLARLDETPRMPAPPAAPAWFPAALRQVLPVPYDDLRWGRATLRVRAATLSPAGPKAQLLRAPPGTSLPLHGHGGRELTLVLKGAYVDEHGTFRRGDVADLEGAAAHRPVIAPGEECVCLVVAAAPLRLRGPILGPIQRLLGR